MSGTQEHYGNRFRELLRQRIGKHGIPVEMVEELTGISERRIRSHVAHDGTKPNSDDMGAYIQLFGEDFLNAWTAPMGITGAYRSTKVNGCLFESALHAMTHASGLMVRLSEAVDDGKIDHIERRSIPGHILSATSYLNAVAAQYEGYKA